MGDKSKLIKEAFALLEKINTNISKEYEALLKHELTHKQILLLRTVRDEGKITVNMLSEKLSLSPSSLSQLIGRMEASHYLKRELNVENRREVFVSLAENGLQYVKDYEDIDNDIIKKYYADFTIEEAEQFKKLVIKLYKSIENEKTL